MSTPTPSRANRAGRRPLLRLAGAVLIAMAATGSEHAAAHDIHGPIKVCSPSTGTCSDSSTGTNAASGAPGSKIKVWAWGLKAKPARYALFFGTGSQSCVESATVLNSPTGEELEAMRTDRNGTLDRDLATAGIQPHRALIPADAPPGPASICARERYPVPENSSTVHSFNFTVLDPG